MDIAYEVVARRKGEEDLARHNRRGIRLAEEAGQQSADKTFVLIVKWRELRTVILQTLDILAAHDYCEGWPTSIVEGHRPRRTWTGRRYWIQETAVRALWTLSDSDYNHPTRGYGTSVHLGSDGKLYEHRRPDYSYCDKQCRYAPSGFHAVNESMITEVEDFDRIVASLRRLQARVQGGICPDQQPQSTLEGTV